jgi:hypothetical protein
MSLIFVVTSTTFLLGVCVCRHLQDDLVCKGYYCLFVFLVDILAVVAWTGRLYVRVVLGTQLTLSCSFGTNT